MKLLMLGGTKFVGRHLVEAALARGHELTLFHRGRTNPELFSELEVIRGDRDHDLDRLAGRSWDAVIDTSGYLPRLVSASARRLSETVERYVFISSISVYGTGVSPGADETTPVLSLGDPTIEVVNGETYGPLKVLCEAAIEAELPGRALHVRPGLIVGPEDPTDRFTYWPCRVARGGEVLAPGDPRQPVQFIDARDLAAWIVRQVEAKATGVYNATGPREALGMGAFLEACRAALGKDARFTWVDEAFLLEREVRPFSELPLWMPAAQAGFSAISSRKAQEAGLTYRPLAETIQETATSRQGRGEEWQAGMASGREQELLAAWSKAHERRSV